MTDLEAARLDYYATRTWVRQLEVRLGMTEAGLRFLRRVKQLGHAKMIRP